MTNHGPAHAGTRCGCQLPQFNGGKDMTISPTDAQIDAFKQAWGEAHRETGPGTRVSAGLTAAFKAHENDREALEALSRDLQPETWSIIDSMSTEVRPEWSQRMIDILGAALTKHGFGRDLSGTVQEMIPHLQCEWCHQKIEGFASYTSPSGLTAYLCHSDERACYVNFRSQVGV